MASTATALIVAGHTHGLYQALVTVALSVFVLVFCEIAPKSLALRFNERLALRLAAPVEFLTRSLSPLIAALALVARLLLRLFTRGRPTRARS